MLDFNNINSIKPIQINDKQEIKNNDLEKRGGLESEQKTSYSAYPSASLLKAMHCNDKKKINAEYEKNKEFIKKSSFYKVLYEHECDFLARKLCSDSKSSEPLKKLISFIEDGTVHKYLLSPIFKKAELQQNIVDDINLMQEAKDKNIPIGDLIVKSYDSVDEGEQNSKVGDVFCVEKEKNVYIKTDEESSKQLKFDKETYLKLFQPIERFASNQAMSSCYFVSVIDKLYQDPDQRVRILDCFEQDGNDVIAKLPNSDKTLVAKNCKLNDKNPYKGFNKKDNETLLLRGAIGLRILESLYDQIRVDGITDAAKAQTYDLIDIAVRDDLQKDRYMKYYNDLKRLNADKIARYSTELEYLKNSDDLLETEDCDKKELIKSFKDALKELNIEKESIAKKLKEKLPQTEELMTIQLKLKDELYENIKTPDNLWLDYLGLDYEEDENGYYTNIKPLVAENYYGVLYKKDKKIRKKYPTPDRYYKDRFGGYQQQILDLFKIPAKTIDITDDKRKKDFIDLIKQDPSKYNIFAGSYSTCSEKLKKIYKKIGFNYRHAYSFNVSTDKDGNLKFEALNPYNTAFSVEFNEEDFLKYFCRICIAQK